MLIANAPAKVNLFLNVIGKRLDNYHLLESLFIPLKLYDQITLSPIANKSDITVRMTLPYNSPLFREVAIEQNIVFKIAKKLQQTFAIRQGADIAIAKIIPMQAGLGGGSSNAATVLKLLCSVWNIKLSAEELIDFSASLGADIPFFILAQPSFVEGIGDKITPLSLTKEKLFLLLVNPNIPVSTSEIFKMGFNQFSEKISRNSTEKIVELIYSGSNDLQDNAIKLNPGIELLIKQLQQLPGCLAARMSGSGATCFAIFDNQNFLQKAEQHFRNSGYWTYSEIV